MASMIEEITTRDLPVEERLPYWNDVVQQLVGPIMVEALCPETFNADMQRIRFRNCEIISVVSGPARLSGGNHGPTERLNLQIQNSGSSRNLAGGRISDLEKGDFVLFDGSQETLTEFDAINEALILRIPVAAAEERLPRIRQMAGVPIRGNSGPGALFSRFLRDAWVQMQKAPGAWVDAFDDMIWPLLEMAYAAERANVREGNAREERRRALFAVIEANLCDPDLDVHNIARHMGVSARYVQMLFAEMATTPTAYIQHRRLELAGTRLKREGTLCSITDVAFDVGFNDLSSFCRAFRRRFDVAPREYRAGMRRNVTQPVAMPA